MNSIPNIYIKFVAELESNKMVDYSDSHQRELLLTPEIKEAEKQIKEANFGKNHSFLDLKKSGVGVTEIMTELVLEGPIFKKRLTVPLRTKYCTHPTAFDMNELLYTIFLKKGKKECLIASCKKPFTHFLISLLTENTRRFLAMLARTPTRLFTFMTMISFYARIPSRLKMG